MKNKQYRKIGFIITVIYLLLCLSPYFIDGFNQIEPKLFGVPFTVWSALILVLIFCIFLKYMSNKVWYHYDTEKTGKEE